MIRIVDFEKWCATCKHQTDEETEEPCNTCLDNPVNEDSRKPICWEEK